MESYSVDEVLAIERDIYAFQSFHDPEVEQGHELLLETTISKWRTICDLAEPKALACRYIEFFDLQGHEQQLVELLRSETTTTLGDLCSYVAKNAKKEPIKPVRLLGSDCNLISLFRAFELRLRSKAVDTTTLKPSSEFMPFFQQYPVEVTEVVAKLAPGTIRAYKLDKVKSGKGFLGNILRHSQLSIEGLQSIKDLIVAMSAQIYGK